MNKDFIYKRGGRKNTYLQEGRFGLANKGCRNRRWQQY